MSMDNNDQLKLLQIVGKQYFNATV